MIESFVVFHSSEIRDLLSILVYDRKAFFILAETETGQNSHFSFWPKPIQKLKKTDTETETTNVH